MINTTLSWSVQKRRVGRKPSSVCAVMAKTAICLGQPLRADSSGLPGTRSGVNHTTDAAAKGSRLKPWSLIRPCSQWGLPSQPPHGSCGELLPRLFTIAGPHKGELGLCVFCGTFPGVAPGGRYPPPCPMELGLSSERQAVQRLPGPLC